MSRRRQVSTIEAMAATLGPACQGREVVNSPEKQKEYAKQERKRTIAKIELAILIWPTIVAWVVACFLFVPINDLMNGMAFDSTLFEFGMVAMVMAIACSVLCYRLSQRSQQGMSIQDQLMGAEKKLTIADAQMSMRLVSAETPWNPELLAKFQAKDLPELLQRQQERNAFMEHFREVNSLPADDSSGWQTKAAQGYVQTVPPKVQSASHQPASQKVRAIMAYREQHPGVGLAEAKAAVEASMAGKIGNANSWLW